MSLGSNAGAATWRARLKEVEVPSIDDRDVNRFLAQRLGSVQTGETSTNNDDAGEAPLSPLDPERLRQRAQGPGPMGQRVLLGHSHL